MKRPTSTYANVADELHLLEPQDLVLICSNARVLDIQECMHLLYLEWDELAEVDKHYAKLAYKRGKATALNDAGNLMFQSMAQRGGGDSAMRYIISQSKFFAQADADGAKATGSSGFTFNVIMPEDKD